MRRAVLLTIITLCCFNVFGQNTSFGDLFTLNLPNSVERQTKEHLKSIHARSKSSPLNLDTGKGDFYAGEGFILQLNAAFVNLESSYLDELKKGRDEVFSWSLPPKYTSTIKSLHNYRVLVIQYEYDVDQSGYYTFYIVSNTNHVALNGIMEYSKTDRGKAAKAMDELLQGLSFKK